MTPFGSKRCSMKASSESARHHVTGRARVSPVARDLHAIMNRVVKQIDAASAALFTLPTP